MYNIDHDIKAEINIKTAMDILSNSWDEISEKAIRNCWIKANILPEIIQNTIQIEVTGHNQNEDYQLQSELDKSGFNNILANEFASIDDNETIEEELTDLSICFNNLGNAGSEVKEPNSSSDDLVCAPVSQVSFVEAISSVETAIRFCEQKSNDFSNELQSLRKMCNRLK